MASFTAEQFKAMQAFHTAGNTRSFQFRKQQLITLKKAIKANEAAITAALQKDLHKSAAEAYTTEIGFSYAELSHTIKHLQHWMQPKNVGTPLTLFPSSSKIVREPWGISLIIAPWNYPFQLLIAPLIGAIAGGNCAVLKPSEFTPATADVIEKMISENFDPQYISVVLGDGAVVVPQLMNENRFDHIFFTGSIPVGKIIAKLAAEKLIPTTLELGGKSPCIVDTNVDLDTAAARIVWGKFTNAGQTCVAPDYVLVQQKNKDVLVDKMKAQIERFYGKDPKASEDYGRIVNEKRFDAVSSYLNEGKILVGGTTDRSEKYIAPTIIENITADAAVMKYEIFGPVLPVIVYNTKEEALNIIQQNANPLSLYVFSNDKNFQEYFTEQIPFGGGCINNTLVHLANPDLPFGGVGNSGSGQYHGQYSFETFTRPKAIVNSATWIDPDLKYPPYKKKLKLFKWLIK
jgi:aldehyde dehydrogenase (NAD+)